MFVERLIKRLHVFFQKSSRSPVFHDWRILYYIAFLSNGKFILGEDAKIMGKVPWQKVTIPNVKSKKQIYHNKLTNEIYLSAYTSKQSGFYAYLNVANVISGGIWNAAPSDKLVFCYKSGLIPKANINCDR